MVGCVSSIIRFDCHHYLCHSLPKQPKPQSIGNINCSVISNFRNLFLIKNRENKVYTRMVVLLKLKPNLFEIEK
jgi:hypothetical protein